MQPLAIHREYVDVVDPEYPFPHPIDIQLNAVTTVKPLFAQLFAMHLSAIHAEKPVVVHVSAIHFTAQELEIENPVTHL